MPANGRWPYCDPRWEAARRATLARDGHACVTCHRTTAHGTILDVDHIIEWAKRPDLAFDINNLRTLCRRHHNQKTHGRQRRRRNSRKW